MTNKQSLATITDSHQRADAALTDDAALERIIEESGARWMEDVLHVHGSELMAMLRKAAALRARAPEGYVLVPVDPTIEMLAAIGWGGDVDLAIGHAAITGEIYDCYKAMLAAAQSDKGGV